MFDRLRRHLPALPYPHFMAFAPLDTWARLLLTGSARGGPPRIHPRYWLRIAGGLFTSAIGTAITLPERLALVPILAAKYRGSRRAAGVAGDQHPGPTILCILGYYRSGTTHLHYLLSCDPVFVTPRWYQVLAPQGFALSWTFLRYFLVPFLSARRPQDDVAYGPEYPSEDDFALCNWSLCGTMPGRMVLPLEWDGPCGWRRWTDAGSLTETERIRFRRTLAAFTWKLAALNPSRGILLKTPSHTARVDELLNLFPGRVKFIHLSRPPAAVLRSNVAMHARFGPFLLQDHPGDAAIRERVAAEYETTERAFVEQSRNIPAGHLSMMRYEDLIADPMGEVQRAYAELNLALTPEAERRMGVYIDSVRGYRAASDRAKPPRGSPTTAAGDDDRLPSSLAWMVAKFGHDKVGPVPESATTIPTPIAVPQPAARRTSAGFVAALVAAIACVALWPAIGYIARNRLDWLIWPIGIAIGLSALRTSRRGSLRLGLWAGALVLAVLLAAAWPATFVSERRYHHPSPDRWHHVWLSTKAGLTATNNLWWVGLGVMTALRFASRLHVRPPGL